MTNLTDNIFAVEVLDKYAQLCIDDVFNELYWWSYGGVETVIPLPPGNWKILCTTRTCTHEQTREITGEEVYPSIALAGMCKAKGLDGEKNILLLEKL